MNSTLGLNIRMSKVNWKYLKTALAWSSLLHVFAVVFSKTFTYKHLAYKDFLKIEYLIETLILFLLSTLVLYWVLVTTPKEP